MENKDNNYIIDKKDLKKNKKPLEEIINNNLSQFNKEDIINIFFFLKENENNLIKNKNINFPEALSYINKNIKIQLKIFLEVLCENYDEENIINELYKIIFFKNSDNSILQEKYINKENLTEKEKKPIKNNNICKKKNYISLKKKTKRKKKESLTHSIKIKKNWIIPIKSSFSEIPLKEEEISQNIIAYLYKNNSNDIFIYYPIFEENIFTNDNMNKIIEDKKKILFVCELNRNEQIKDKCNSYGIYNLETMDFSLGAKHSKTIEEHKISIKSKLNSQFSKKNELFDIYLKFSKMKIKGALIIKN